MAKFTPDPDERAFGTRTYEHAQTSPVWCSCGCGVPIMGSRVRWEMAVVVEIWKDANGRDMPVGRKAYQSRGDRWDRREVFLPGCVPARYGEPEPLAHRPPVRSRI